MAHAFVDGLLAVSPRALTRKKNANDAKERADYQNKRPDRLFLNSADSKLSVVHTHSTHSSGASSK